MHSNVRVDIMTTQELSIITSLYNKIFTPNQPLEYFVDRLTSHRSPLILTAFADDIPIGFALGYEHRPGVFFQWRYGVLKDYRGQGVGSQLIDASQTWIQEQNYQLTRIECLNHHRAMLHMTIAKNYQIVGLRHDNEIHANLILMEKDFSMDV
ncbi:GNAT family N-acetyltransferase [Planctomycetota bacterium]|nr:GNAT family N-acetyltransferase [Planctomycetota bacterium]